MSDLLPPQNIELEEAVLGCLLFDPKGYYRIQDVLAPESFVMGAHQEIYRAIALLAERGDGHDLMSVTVFLANKKRLEAVGGQSKLAQLREITVSSTNIDRYAQILREKQSRRELIAVGQKAIELGHDTAGNDLVDSLDQIQKQVLGISSQSGARRCLVSPEETTNRLQLWLEEDGDTIPTEFDDLNAAINGFTRGELTIIAGRPGSGKSALAADLMIPIARYTKQPIALFQLEMSLETLSARIISRLTTDYFEGEFPPLSLNRIKQQKARNRGGIPFTEQEWASWHRAIADFEGMKIHISEIQGLSASDIITECRKLVAEQGQLGAVIVDYLQLMGKEVDAGRRSLEIGGICKQLRAAIKNEFHCPLIMLAQVSRDCEKRQDKRPMLSDLGQSGVVEQDADNVLMLYRDEYYNPKTPEPGVAEIIVRKARNGSVGTVKVDFLAEYATFQSRQTMPSF